MDSSRRLAATSDEEACFWETKALADLTEAEWEALCDGCGKCCLHKLEDEETGQLFHTNVACRLLDLRDGRCTRYTERFRWVPDCVQLTPAEVRRARWLPVSCAYRLRAEGRSLPSWHPLRTGDSRSTQRAGMTIMGWAVSERQGRQLENHILERLP
ncbi:MAG: YcgN family cysteine cluster protein [Gammaproteobacteria bacterium]|nr:YcgN family cysteine cluster protein [Gammaproteobacteria bacterium]